MSVSIQFLLAGRQEVQIGWQHFPSFGTAGKCGCLSFARGCSSILKSLFLFEVDLLKKAQSSEFVMVQAVEDSRCSFLRTFFLEWHRLQRLRKESMFAKRPVLSWNVFMSPSLPWESKHWAKRQTKKHWWETDRVFLTDIDRSVRQSRWRSRAKSSVMWMKLIFTARRTAPTREVVITSTEPVQSSVFWLRRTVNGRRKTKRLQSNVVFLSPLSPTMNVTSAEAAEAEITLPRSDCYD